MTEAEGQAEAQPLLQRAQHTRTALMITELEDVALAMFEERGFVAVSVEQIAAKAGISTRTFYRYFPNKEDVLQVRIYRRAEGLRRAFADRPEGEALLHSLRVAVENALSEEDPALLKRWIAVVAATPSVLKTVLGGCILIENGTIAAFFGRRLALSADALIPAMLAAAAGAVIQAAQTRWLTFGGDLASSVSEGLRVLEEGVGTSLGSLTDGAARSSSKRRDASK